MSVIRIIIIVLLSLLLIFLIAASTLALTSNMLLYPEFYTESLEKSGFYSSLNQSVPIDIDTEETKDLVNEIITEVLAYIRSDSNSISVSREISNDFIRDNLLKEIDKLEICTPKQLEIINQGAECLPPGITPELFVDTYLEYQEINLTETNTIDLAEVTGFNEGSEARQTIDQLRKTVVILKYLFVVFIIGILLLSAIIFILIPKRKELMILIIGISILTASLLLLIIGYSAQIGGANYIDIDNQFVGSLTKHVLLSFSSDLINHSFKILLVGIILSIIGTISLFVNKKPQKTIRKQSSKS